MDQKYKENALDREQQDAELGIGSLKQKRKLEDVETSSAAKRLKGAPANDESGSEYSEEGTSSDDESSTVPRAKRRQKDTPEDEGDDSSEGSDEGDLSPGDDGDDFEDTDEEVEVRQPAVAKGKRDKANVVVAESDDEVSDDDDDGESDDDLGSEESSDAGGLKVGKAERIRSGGKGEEKPGQKTASVSGKKHVAESSKAKKGREAPKSSKKVKFADDGTDEGTDPDFSDEESAEGEDDESCDKLEDETPASGKKTPAAALKNKDGTWEDIYGRLRDKDGNVVSQKYVPPAKRLQSGQLDSKKKEELARLKKQLKGLLNRCCGTIASLFCKVMGNLVSQRISPMLFFPEQLSCCLLVFGR